MPSVTYRELPVLLPCLSVCLLAALQYSSAAPLTADARQRIVGEVFDLRRFVTVSMTVGPASGVLKELPEESWKARDVALTVLIDRCVSAGLFGCCMAAWGEHGTAAVCRTREASRTQLATCCCAHVCLCVCFPGLLRACHRASAQPSMT
jgi:hypothetical protein